MIDKSFTNNENEKIQHFLQHKERHKNTIKAYTDGLKNMEKKVDFAVVFTDITSRCSAKMTVISIVGDPQKKRRKMSKIYRHSELNAIP